MHVTQQPFRFGVHVAGLMSRAELLDTAHMAEDLGFAVLGSSDHLHHSFAQLSPMVALATVAAHTTTLELQTLVLANDFRHPVVIAKEAATLDVLSQGRFSLGLGAGWLAPDYHAADIEFLPPPNRVARVAEAIAIFKGLQSGEPFNFEGDHYRINGLVGTPQPCRSPIPLLVAGSGRTLLSLAARTADTVALNPGLPMSAGRWQTGPSPYADVTDKKLQWIRAAAGDRFERLEIQAAVFAGGITDGDTEPLLAPVASMLGVSVAQLLGSPHVLAGTLEQCVETVLGWRERWGISYLTFPSGMARGMAPLVTALRGV